MSNGPPAFFSWDFCISKHDNDENSGLFQKKINGKFAGIAGSVYALVAYLDLSRFKSQ